MPGTSRFPLALSIVCVVLLASCTSRTPAEKVAATRAEYKATLNSFFVKETPLEVVVPEGEAAEGAVADDSAEAPMEGDEAPPAEVPVRQDAVLDVIVQHDTSSPLAGLTLDISMVDSAENEIESWRRWIDTEGLPKANQRPYSIVFEDVAYEEGHGFFVEIRHPIAEAERGQYREFEGL